MSARLPSDELTVPARKSFPSSSGQMFQNYFASEREDSYRKRDLIDARARRLFENTALACSMDAYPFQAPLSTRPGPMVEMNGHRMLMLSSYDYLGLIGDQRVDEAAIAAVRKYGTGTGGVRLLTGTLDLHQEMEEALAEFKGTEAAITFTSGYAANLAVISALFGPADRVIADALSHRSLMDACRLAGVQVQRFEHNDPASLRHELENGPEANRTLIVSDGVFSMDGDICCLPELIALKKEFDCFLLMDESHASGVLGERGRGTDEHFGISTEDVDIWTGSLAKAIPSNGGFVAVSRRLAIFLQHASAPFIFSGALAAPAAAAVSETLKILKQEPERVDRLRANAAFLREGLQSLGYDTGLSQTAIVPVMLYDDTRTALFARKLRDYGVLVSPVLFPAVAQGAARLRLCVTAAHTSEHLQFALDVFEKMRSA
ncbi:aminotransferase class I/II-fold pyridoxal phosphate-dependent enzyme [Paracidobacterium acidisoli]|uniref:Aminotransferase class I/II-fold pyridoxal phosphate-dependent enzyme n=1 Tax=Paracidobacterium acidisoli TaxID=2303751 RepID=A0A372IQC6_9BACT|nr:aminotransferase class I/II-fold pyridoxal phosphate-dependent enzyme [Paracidobacterium acidisoli]MBT9331527.1 aminotransferase class I/II-fold pyridoxal phosphate-dependent enzyme [Paracidobacterium acidisoli]